MATPAQIERQYQRELQSHAEGIKRLQEATHRAEERVYASSSIYGQKLIDQGLDDTINAIEEKRSKIAAGSTAEFAAHVAMLKDVPSSTLALITIKSAVDVVFGKWRTKMGGAQYSEVVQMIGARVYDEILLSEFSQAFPEDFRRTKIHQSKGYSYRVAKYRAIMRRIGHEALRWPTGHRVKIGGWLMDRLVSATGWFEAVLVTTKYPKQITILRPVQAVHDSVEAILVAAEAVSACRWPMLCEPNDWTPDLHGAPGGYLTSELRSQARCMIRGTRVEALDGAFLGVRDKGMTPDGAHLMPGDERGEEEPLPALAVITPCPLPPSLDIPVSYLNSIQHVPFQINNKVLEVALRCQEARVSVGSLRQSDPLPLPHKPDPWETATEEEKTTYKRGRVLVEEDNSLLAQRNYQTTETLHIAKMYRDEESFWFPWFFDFRGRVYPLTNHLTPQGTDLARSLLVSALSGPADRYWLAFQVATTHSMGKATMDDRQAWVEDNLELIEAVALDPMGTISTWKQADDPWQFMAACIEYHACFISKERDWSNLFVGFDATCSGLQHLSALTRDRGAAEMVNVAPTALPADAYKTVAEASKKYLDEEFHHLINRKLTKRVVMCLPYGLTRSSARDYLRQALPRDAGVPLKDLVDAVYLKAIPEVLHGPMRARSWIQESVNRVVDATGRPVAFTSPSGFPVLLSKQIFPTEQIDTKLLGKRIRITVADFDRTTAPLNGRKITIGSVPNLIHSLDGALLHLSFAQWDRPIALVHDCISTLSCDVAWTMDHIRETFATMYETDQLASWAEQLGVEVDPAVMINTLDPNEIRKSTYLFC